jgi:hypothetical protein
MASTMVTAPTVVPPTAMAVPHLLADDMGGTACETAGAAAWLVTSAYFFAST